MTTETKAGLFAVAGIAVLLASIILIRGGFQFRERGYELKLRMTNAQGITAGAPVLMAGIEVGRVKRLGLTPERRAELTLRIREGVTIPAGSRFATATAGVLGDRFIAISPGPIDAPPLPPDSVVVGSDPFTLEQLFDRLSVVARRAEETLVSINRLVSDPKLASDIGETVRNAREATAVARQVAENVQRMTRSLEQSVATEVPAIARELRAMAADLAGAAHEIRTLVKDVSADGETARQIRDTLGSVQRAAGRMDKMAQDLSGLVNEEQIRSIRRTIAEAQSAVSEARQGLTDARQGVAEVRQGVAEARAVVGRAGAAIDRVNKLIPERLGDVPGLGLRAVLRLDYELWYAGTRAGHDVRLSLLPTGARQYIFTWRDVGFSNRLGLQIGQRLENSQMTVRYGLIDGQIGVGLDYGTAPGTVVSLDLYNINSLTLNVYTYYFLSNEYAISLRGTNLLNQPTLGIGVLRRF
ncbi:MAG: MlaD family protein [Armatimonadota bacterium]